MDIINGQIVQHRDLVDVRTKRLEIICLKKQVDFVESQIKLLQHKYQAHVCLVKLRELEIWSLQISSFQRNSSSLLQASYFGLYKCRVSTILSQLVMLKKNKRAVTS
jgi:hypothetical protein